MTIIRDILNTHDVWFTDASVKQSACGYGIFNHTTGLKEYGGLGSGIAPKMAEMTAIQICTDSLEALGVLRAPKIRSKLVLETVQLLNKIALERQVNLLWAPARSGIQGNVTADELARRGANSVQMWPNLVNLRDENGHKNSISMWLQDQTQLCWQQCSNARHSKSFIQTPSRELCGRLLTLSKREMRTGVGIITDHLGLNAHLSRIRIREDPLCDRCSMGEETGLHFLCECPAWSSTRTAPIQSHQR